MSSRHPPLNGFNESIICRGGARALPHAKSSLLQIADGIAGELLELPLIVVRATDVPLVGSETHSEDATSEGRCRSKVDDTGAAVVDDVVPRAEHGRVGRLLPSLHDVGIGSQAVGIEVPHTVVVALDAGTLEAVDRALVETADEVHAAIDVMTRVVVDLSFSIADDGLRAPHVVVLSALAIAEDARSIGFGDTADGHGELCGVVGEEEVATILAERLQGVDGLSRSEVAGEVLIAVPAAVSMSASALSSRMSA